MSFDPTGYTLARRASAYYLSGFKKQRGLPP